MNILFLHRNFPAQFRHLAPALASNPNNKVVSHSLNNYYRILANEAGLVNIPLYGNNLMINPCSLLVLAR